MAGDSLNPASKGIGLISYQIYSSLEQIQARLLWTSALQVWCLEVYFLVVHRPKMPHVAYRLPSHLAACQRASTLAGCLILANGQASVAYDHLLGGSLLGSLSIPLYIWGSLGCLCCLCVLLVSLWYFVSY